MGNVYMFCSMCWHEHCNLYTCKILLCFNCVSCTMSSGNHALRGTVMRDYLLMCVIAFVGAFIIGVLI